MARGYEVWWDVNRIRAGRPWDEEVQTGLQNSQVLLALPSPQSVRRARDARHPTATDSVCLDEIAYDRGLKIPIVPILVVSCEAPFLVCRFEAYLARGMSLGTFPYHLRLLHNADNILSRPQVQSA